MTRTRSTARRPGADGEVLRRHGTRLFDLPPGLIVAAAESDMRAARYNGSDAAPPFQAYAFHRHHVRRAKDALNLIEIAIDDGPRGRKSKKPNTAMIYRARRALKQARATLRARAMAALEAAQGEAGRGAPA